MEDLESKIEEDFTLFAARSGCLCKKLKLDGIKGWPDRTILGPNRLIFFIEFKRPRGAESVHQERTRKMLRKFGHHVYVIDSFEEAKSVLIKELKEND